MDVIVRLTRFAVLFLVFTACSQIHYGVKQGAGQMRLLWGAIPNQEALQSTKLTSEEKRKLRLVEDYRRYFYDFWGEEPKATYQKFYQLSDPAVTYLVIVSSRQKIEAQENCFAFAGCFPYLGFFDYNDARRFAVEQEQRDFVTWIRPVYAYSTLGYFNDPILSSFFTYSDLELAQLIFHELFHTIFFIEGEVEFNENLANFFADRLIEEYFKHDSRLETYQRDMVWFEQGMKQLVFFAQELNQNYTSLKLSPDTIFSQYLEQKINPWRREYCEKREQCWANELNYNNASLAAYLTYEAQDQVIQQWYASSKMSVNQFYHQLKKYTDQYKQEKSKTPLVEYLSRRISRDPSLSYRSP